MLAGVRHASLFLFTFVREQDMVVTMSLPTDNFLLAFWHYAL